MKLSALLLCVCFLLSACQSKTDLEDLEHFVVNNFDANQNITEQDQVIQELSQQLSSIVEPIAYSQIVVNPFDKNRFSGQQMIVEDLQQTVPKKSHRLMNKDFIVYFSFYPIEQLQLVGIVEQGGVKWAIVAAPDNSVQRIRQGQYLGENHGQVRQVSRRGIEVVELIKNQQGTWIERQVYLSLKEYG